MRAAVDLAVKGAYLVLRNAKIDMYRGSMRLAVDQWGKVEAAADATFAAKVRHGTAHESMHRHTNSCAHCTNHV